MRRRDLVLFSVGVAGVVAMPISGAVAGHLADALLPVTNVLSYLLVGGYAAWRRPEHRAAQRMLLWGVLLAVAYGWGAIYSAIAVSSAHQSGAAAPGWGWIGILALNVLGWLAATASLAFIVVFPDGTYRTEAERWVVRVTIVLLPIVTIGEMVGLATMTSTDFVWGDGLSAPNPLAVPALATVGLAAQWCMKLISPAALLTGAVFLLVRWFRSDAADRRRIQWPLAAVAATAVLAIALGALSAFAPPPPVWLQVVIYVPVVFLIPAGLLVGMLWYDLLDLGIVLRRSALYAALWLVITAGYLLLAGVAGVIAVERLPWAMAVATTVVVVAAAASGRRRLTRFADRVVFGRRVDTSQLISDIGRRLDDEGQPTDIAAMLADAARRGVRAEWVTVHLGTEVARAAASDSSAERRGEAPPEPTIVVPLAAEGARVGEIACGKREIGSYSARDLGLLETLGRLAALSFVNARLSAQLVDKVEELEASRARILHAEDAGRRQVERDLHDGVQQDLVGLLARLGLVANQLKRDPALAAVSLGEAHADTRRTLEDLQDLARGIHPTLLTDRGLVAAVEERAARMPLHVRVESDDAVRSERLPPDIEGAAYFAVSECLTNAAKHADAQHAVVRFGRAGDAISVEIIDDGAGFDVGRTFGTGLIGLRDRIETLGGRFAVSRAAPHGTRVTVELPTRGETYA